ncbi:Cytochrome P450 2K1 [Liparis tanakae]|uniref:Cytochrome P450 2K1 n=1 Tax=Liparis tanakae TaxID=230148 RepID=A0A4Z2HUY7_9TELE|nr:Cytochrome P450 2K1 [Liparis tanakae]
MTPQDQLSKKYGSVFKVYFGPQKFVILAGYKTVKQALVNNAVEFGDRHIHPVGYLLGQALLFANGELWKEMRRFALSNLRDHGMGKKASEEKIIEEIQYLIKVFESHEGKPFNVTKSINYAVSNIISSIIYGSRFDYSDEEFTEMLYNLYPRIFHWASNRMRLVKNIAENQKQIRHLIEQSHETLNAQMCRGFVDSFLAHKQKLEDSGMTESYYTIDVLVPTVGNLFAAGTDTTGTTLRWSLLFMARYPQIQGK